jgi:membrane protease YdiL (CAAX protease family)
MPAERPSRDLWAVLVGLVALNALTIAALDAVLAAIVQVAAALGAVAIAIRRGYSVEELGLSSRTAAAGFRLGAACSAVVVVGVVAIAVLPFTRDFLDDERFIDLTGWEAAYEVVIRIPIVTALSEELLFRSVLLAVLLALVTTRRAVVVSSICFGLWHVLVALDDLDENAMTDALGTTGRIAGVVGVVAATAIAGAIFAWTRLRSGSIVAPWLLHAVLNGATFTAGYVLAST